MENRMNKRLRLGRNKAGAIALTVLDERGLYLAEVALTEKECSELSGQALKLAMEKPTERLADSFRQAAEKITEARKKRNGED
jgi:hypothetical protein